MVVLEFPPPAFRIRTQQRHEQIFDALRRRWVRLTPEEWVRQNVLQYVIKVLQYPAALIGVEKEIMVGGLRKRVDILVFDRNHQPWMLIECKAPAIALTDAVLHQAIRYHRAAPASYLVITNGAQTRAWEKKHQSLQEMETLPPYPTASERL